MIEQNATEEKEQDMPEAKPTCPKCGDAALDWHTNIKVGFCKRCQISWEESELTHLRSTVYTLRKALEFYGDTCNYMWWLKDESTKDTRKVLVDAGAIARTALEETK